MTLIYRVVASRHSVALQ